MKKNQIKNIIFLAMFFLLFSMVGQVYAVSPALYIAPSDLTKNIDDEFSVSARVNKSDEKIYAVEGKLIFDNLSCKKITVNTGFVPQSVPTCDNPYFLIGFPSGITQDTAFLSISVKAEKQGNAKISYTKVDIIGKGKSISTNSTAGNYIVKSPEPILTAEVKENSTTPTTDNTDTTSTKTENKSNNATKQPVTGEVAGEKDIQETPINENNQIKTQETPITNANANKSTKKWLYIIIALAILIIIYKIIIINKKKNN